MDTKCRTASAAVTGSRHLRMSRNGQDAAVSLVLPDGTALAVVCDGCGSAPSSEVGARLGATLFAHALRESDFEAARGRVVEAIGEIVARTAEPERAIREMFLFTVVAAVVRGDEIAVWSVGDGCFAIDGKTTQLGPFDDNEPPYVAYELLGMAAPSRLVVEQGRSVVIATDGASELDLARFASAKYVDHPDALRRELARLVMATERIDWEARRVERTPAAVQDDCAVAVIMRGAA